MKCAQVAIEYTQGTDRFKVVLTAENLDVFTRAAESPEVLGRAGAELVDALLAFGGADIVAVERSKNGLLHNGPKGEPAIRTCYHPYDRTCIRLYTNGKLTDGPYGEPAVQDYLGDKLVSARTHRYGGNCFRQLTRLELSELPDVIAQNKQAALKKAYWNSLKPC